MLSLPRAGVQSLVRELRSHKPHGVVKKFKKIKIKVQLLKKKKRTELNLGHSAGVSQLLGVGKNLHTFAGKK